jgi:hypothetical protein
MLLYLCILNLIQFLSLVYFHDLINGIQQQNYENFKPYKLQQEIDVIVPLQYLKGAWVDQ